MLHIIKQIRGGFIGFIEANVISQEEAGNTADKIDSKIKTDDKITLHELHDVLVDKNAGLKKEIRDKVKEIYNDMNGKKGEISKADFIDLLSKQEKENKSINRKHRQKKVDIISGFGNAFKSFGNVIEDIGKGVNSLVDGNKKTEKKSIKTKVEKNETKSIKTKVENNDIKFKRTLKLTKPYMRGDDVVKLQGAIGIKNPDGVFGPGTKKALAKYQRKELGQSGDGVMDLNGATMKSLSKTISNGSAMDKHIQNVENVQTYIHAYNDVYGNAGEKCTKLISDHTGVWGIVQRMGSSDLDRLEDKLGIKLQSTDKQSKQLAEKMGVPVNSPRFKEKMLRMAITAAVSAIASAIASGGNTVYITVELFGINHKAVGDLLGIKDLGVTFSKGASLSKITSLMLGKDVDMRASLKDALVAKDTSAAGLKKLANLYNNADMDTADLKRIKGDILPKNFVVGVLDSLSYGLFESLFGEALPGKYGNIKKLINKFEKNPNIDNLIKTLQGIYNPLAETHKENIAEYNRTEKEFKRKEAKYNKKMNGSKNGGENAWNQALAESTGDDSVGEHESFEMSKTNFEIAKIKLQTSKNSMKEIGDMIGKYGKIKNKLISVNGEKFNKKAAIQENKNTDKSISEGLGQFNISRPKKLHTLTTKELKKLNTSQSFGNKVEISKLKDTKHMRGVMQALASNSKTGEYSMLSEAIRGTRQLKDVPFTEEEFINAFITTAQAEPNKKYVVSNLATMSNAKQQGKISGKLFSITINETKFYFHERCNNPVSVVEEDLTTEQSSKDTPIVKTFKVKDKQEPIENEDSETEENEDSETEENEDSETEENEDSETEENEDSETEENEDSETEENEDSQTEENEDSQTEENEDSQTEENEDSQTEENEDSQTEENEDSETETEPESSETETEPESSETETEPESSETETEPESSETETESESSQTETESESSQTETESESSQTETEPESSETETEPESSQTETEGEGSTTQTPPPQNDE